MPSSKIDVTTADGVADAYLTRPDDDRPHPAVLFVMDAFGLRARIEEMADRIAARATSCSRPTSSTARAGRRLLPVPDPTDPDNRAGFMQSVRPMIAQLTPDSITRDGAAYLDVLDEHVSAPVAITGYCMGARVGWRIAVAYPERVAALGGFHGGGLVTDAPDSPHRSAGELDAELYFGHADEDPSMTAEQIEALDRALDDVGVRHRTEVYEGARHGYTMSDTAAFNEAACERHFTELFALLDRALEPA